jgi:phage-related holin
MKSFILKVISSEPFLLVKGILIFLIGPLNHQLAALLLTLAIDLVFGIMVAKKEKQFAWGKLFTMVRRKLLIYGLWIAMFHAFDVVAGLPNSARWAVVVLLAGLELMSAIKNTARLGYSNLAHALEVMFLALTKNNTALKDAAAAVEELDKLEKPKENAEGGKADAKEDKPE